MREQDGKLRITDEHGELIAILVRSSFVPTGIEFLTEVDLSLQLAIMSRGPSEPSLPHIHIPQIRKISQTMEFIFVRKGNATVNLSDEGGNLVRTIKLGLGDMVLLISGWHSLTFEEGTEIIEVKQGPYSPNSDKIRT